FRFTVARRSPPYRCRDLPQREQTSRSPQSGTGVSGPYRRAIWARLGSTDLISSLPRAFLDKGCHALKAIGGCQQIADYFAGTGSPRELPDFCGLLAVIV